MIYAAIFTALLIGFIIGFFRLYLHLVPKNKLPILMYHSVQPVSKNPLVIPVKNLEEQLKYLQENNYRTLFFNDLDQGKLENNSIILTFDDGYRDNLEYLLPLLKKYNQKAVIFVNTAFATDPDKMSFDEMKNADSSHLEFALHSHSHKNFKEISLEEAKNDLKTNMDMLEDHGVRFQKVFAYPYGRHPKGQSDFYKILEQLGIKYALRIGNKLNYYPFKRKYEICRIGIDGTDSLAKFKLKLFFGKLKF